MKVVVVFILEMMNRYGQDNKPVFLINFDIKDNPEDAAIGARAILTLAQMLLEAKDLESEFEEIMERFQEEKASLITSIPTLHTVCFY